MTRFSCKVALGLVFWGLAACGAPPPAPTSSPAPNPGSPHDSLSRIVERYWDEHAITGNSLTAQSQADSLALERRYLAEILAVPRPPLDPDAALTYDIFKRQRELNIEGLTYPAELMPINPFDGLPQQFARAAAATGQHPLNSAKEYENWLLRIDGYAGWTKQAIANMREGVRRGYTAPQVLMERTLPVLQAYGEDSPANVFYVPLQTMPEAIKDPERTRLRLSLSGAIKDKLLPANRELHEFIQTEYLPRARPSVALSALPLGASWYAALVRRTTGTQLTPNEIHAIGLAEVERIRARLQAAAEGPPAAAGDLLAAYQELKDQTLAAMPTLFSALPPEDFELQPMPAWGGTASPLLYRRAATDDRTPAVLYINTAGGAPRPAAIRIAGFLQEAIPGRHYQAAIQQARADLPKFRRFGSEPAFLDGWALYAASLGEQLGLYRDDEARRGAALGQLNCAVALVVDTGLHAKGWTRAQALDYLRTQLMADADDAALLADRYVAMPADALACKMGELKFQSLLAKAQQALGARFDIRDFHAEILKDGAMPLDILESKMKLWIEARR
jgi:uncharacterized protein (DUF885 family)